MKPFLNADFAYYFKKNIVFSAFISRKNVFLSDIINEVIKKDYERIS